MVRRSPLSLLFLLLVALVALAATACSGESAQRLVSDPVTSTTRDRSTTTVDRTTTSTPSTTTVATTTTTSTTTAPPAPAGDVVVHVTDGDTFDVRLAGSGSGEVETVRLIGINAPESGECLADRATAWLRDRIDGESVLLVRDESERDQYGRLLRYVELDAAGGDRVDVGEEMVRAGLAIARRYPPDTARAAALEAAQAEAERARVGMWSTDACGPPAGGSGDVGFGAVRFDADGNDNHNLNDEWVQVVNRGAVPIDLSGWSLKDESASNRYAFPSRFLLGAGDTVTIRSGCGTDSKTDLHWCRSGSAVWNNGGDTAFLLDPAGNVVDSTSG